MSSEVNTGQVAEDIIESFRSSGETLSVPRRKLFTNYLVDRQDRDPGFSSAGLWDERNNSEYDWDSLTFDLQIYLEKRMDRNNIAFDNPEKLEPVLDSERVYHFNFVDVGIEEYTEAFMTSILHCQDPDSLKWTVYAEYLDEEEGLEAVNHLLKHGETEKVEDLLEKELGAETEKALKVYEKAVAENDLGLAKKMLQNTEDIELQTSMRAKLVQNPSILEEFGDSLDY